MCADGARRRKVSAHQPFLKPHGLHPNKAGEMFNGFIAVRRGLLEHLRRGKLTELEALTFIIILGLANPYTGIWYGSAKSLWGEYPFYGNERRARRALEGLASKWYIKRLSTPGKHSNYPILIDKYEVKVGEKVGLRLNARKSRNERSLLYEKVGARQGEGELGVIHGGEQVVKDGVFGVVQTPQKAASSPPLLKKEKENEKEKENKHPAQPLASPDYFKGFWEQYPRKVGRPAAQKAWKKIKASEGDAVFTGLERWKATEQWQKEGGKFIPYPATFLNQRRWEDEPLSEAEKNSMRRTATIADLERIERKPGKCGKCGAEIPAGFKKCLKCMKEKP